MTPGRMALFAIAGLTAGLAGGATVLCIVLALLSVIGWLWVAVCAIVFVAALVLATVTFIKVLSNLDESFEPNGILGKFMKQMETKF